MKKIRVLILIIIVMLLGINVYGVIDKTVIPKKNQSTENSIDSTIAVYIQDNDGNYIKSTTNELPKKGYLLNSEMSTCTNGGTVSQDYGTRNISLSTIKQSKCTLYYDKIQKTSVPAETILSHLGLTANTIIPNFSKISPNSEVIINSKYTNFTNVTNENTNYPFSYSDGEYTSTNKKHSTTSTITFYIGETTNMFICYTVSSEADCDKATFYLDDVQKAQVSGSTSGCIDLGTIRPSNVIKVTYSKDGSTSSGNDNVIFFLTNDYTINNDDSGIYAMADDYGTSYYFRGNVTNNYVRFGKWNEDKYIGYYKSNSPLYKDYDSLSECQSASSYNVNCTKVYSVGDDMYWRIIRINGDGSIRMIYDGTQAYANGTSSSSRYVTTSKFNSSSNKNAYVGYMYGSISGSTYAETHANTNSSTIKDYLENTWYKTNIKDKGYSKYLSDEIFCNDRSLDTSNSSYTGIGTTRTYYGAYQRLVRNTTKTPQLTCPQKNDAFTVDDTEKGNGALTYPVGLITADEISLAGGASDASNSSYYLYKGDSYLSLSPYYYYTNGANVFYVSSTGDLGHNTVVNGNGVAPVINISPEYAVQMTGSGTASDPFTVS